MMIMKEMRVFSIASLAMAGILFLGCNGKIEQDLPVKEQGDNVVTLTTSVGFADGTRALLSDVDKAFAVGERIAVVYTNTDNERVKAVSEPLKGNGDIYGSYNKNASFTVTLTNPVAGTVDFIYPAVMATEAGEINYDALKEQNGGTRDAVAAQLDCATGSGNLVGEGNQFSLSGNFSLENQFLIAKFKIKDNKSGVDVTKSLTQLTVEDGTYTYVVNYTSVSYYDFIYVVMRPVSSDQTLVFNATDGTSHYRRYISGRELKINNVYNITLNCGKFELGRVIADDGNIYPDANAIPAGVTGRAMICYVGDSGEDAPYNHGLAIALKNAGDSKWCPTDSELGYPADYIVTNPNKFNLVHVTDYSGPDAAKADMSGISNTNWIIDDLVNTVNQSNNYPMSAAYKAKNHAPLVPGCSQWFLPAFGQAYKFLQAYGKEVNVDLGTWASATTASLVFGKIDDCLEIAGGTKLAADHYKYGNYLDYWRSYYWLSTEKDYNHAYYLGYDVVEVGPTPGDGMVMEGRFKDSSAHVRAFLAF